MNDSEHRCILCVVEICQDIVKDQRKCEERSNILNVLFSDWRESGGWQVPHSTQTACALAWQRI